MLRLCDRPFAFRFDSFCRTLWAGATCLVLALPSKGGAASTFAPISTYASGGAAQYTTVADANRDGKPDVFVSNLNGLIAVVVGRGDGSFFPPATIAQLAAGSYPIATDDFNGDGVPDLAVLAAGAGKVLIYLGHGDGTFEAPKSAAVPNSPKYMVVGDVNGDHHPDLLFNAVSGTNSGFTILLSQGNGSFRSPRMITAVNAAAGSVLAVGDVNNDGHLDVVTCNSDSQAESFLGNGDGTFREQPSFGDGVGPVSEGQILLANIYRRGKLDLVVGNYGYQGFQGTLTIIEGNGDGTFADSNPQYLTAGFFPAWLAAADMNGDGKTDVVVGNAFSNSVSVLLNQGNGNLVRSLNNYATPYLETDLSTPSPGLLSVGDFNGDGKPDVALATMMGVQVLSNLGGGVLNAPGSVEVFQYTGQMFAHDFDGDGKLDLAVETDGIEGVIIGSVEVLSGNGKGGFSVASTNFPEEPGIEGVGGGDFNGNGRLGVAAFGYGDGIFTSYNLGNNNFVPGPTLEIPNQPNSFCAGDFNHDNYSDFAVLDGNQVDVYLNQHGSYGAPVTYNVGANPYFIFCRALRRGGPMDLITANHDSNDISVLLGKGNGTFAAAVDYFAGTNAEAITTGDFNRDGRIDIAVGGKKQIAVLRGLGDGTFAPATFSPAPGPVTYLTQVDLRGTGIEDIVSVKTDFKDFAIPNDIFLFSGKGDGTFASPVAMGAGADPYWVTGGDFNNDGTPDLVVSDYYSSALVLLMNRRGTYISLKSNSANVKAGEPVTFTLTLSASVAGAGRPEGTVAFKDNGKTVSIARLSGGKAEFTTTKLSAGTHHISASYWGNADFNPHVSSSVSIRVD